MTSFGATLGFRSQALFLEVTTEETDQHCSTLRLPQWADNPAFLIVDERYDLRECFLAGVAVEFVVGHMDLPRLACCKHCRPAESALPPWRTLSHPSRIIF